MKRITPEDVVDAYIATGMYPVFRKWRTRDGKGGCGLTAIGGLNGHCVKSGSRYRRFTELLGLDHSYVVGFTRGFDGYDEGCEGDKKLTEHDPYALGLADGLSARKAVKAHFAKAKQESQSVATAQEEALVDLLQG